MSNTETVEEKTNHSGTAIKIDYDNLKRAARIIRSVNHRLRQQILKLLDESGRLPVTEIYVKLRLEQSVASQHLAILRDSGAVKTEREGKFIYYSLNDTRLDQLAELVDELVK
ncbi:MAG: metalloregulator ArsR/SmtB family transcription factor [Chitinophagales bacterium]